jgi:hypothetical protein
MKERVMSTDKMAGFVTFENGVWDWLIEFEGREYVGGINLDSRDDAYANLRISAGCICDVPCFVGR